MAAGLPRDRDGDTIPAMSDDLRVPLSAGMQQRLAEAPRGTGGYQTLVAEIRDRVRDASLAVDDELIERIEHYAFDYGSGGWQSLLRELLAEIQAQRADK